jgi:hypothetical protein
VKGESWRGSAEWRRVGARRQAAPAGLCGLRSSGDDVGELSDGMGEQGE